jgi:hypothetical protein
MAHVRFTRDYDYHPTRHVWIAYKAGQSYSVKRECADAAIAAGAAVEEDAPSKAHRKTPGDNAD